MVENLRNNFSIKDILKSYSNIFLDTNVLLHVGAFPEREKMKNLFLYNQIKESLLDFWIPLFEENSGMYLTRNVYEEIKKDHYNYKKEIKKGNGRKSVEIMRIRKELKKKRNSFLNGFPPERIVDRSTLENKAIYDELHEKYNRFGESLNEIGEKDFDFLLLGAVFSKSKGNTCLISNDSGILRCYNDFLKGEMISREKYGFYFQQELNLFKKR